MFTRRNYLTMTARGESPAPGRTVLGQRVLGAPTILVTNQHSLSDAEDFTEGYRALKAGKVVGEPTAGWIIYTSNVPLIGKTKYPNLYLNTGHGTLGWTMAAGSGKALADIISGEKPEVDFRFTT